MDTLGKIIEDYIQRQTEQKIKEFWLDTIQYLNELKGCLTWNEKTEKYEMTFTNYIHICNSLALLKDKLGETNENRTK